MSKFDCIDVKNFVGKNDASVSYPTTYEDAAALEAAHEKCFLAMKTWLGVTVTGRAQLTERARSILTIAAHLVVASAQELGTDVRAVPDKVIARMVHMVILMGENRY